MLETIQIPIDLARSYLEEEWDGVSYLSDGEEPARFAYYKIHDQGQGYRGHSFKIVIRDRETQELWAHDYENDTTKHGDYRSYDYSDTLTFHRVEEVSKTVIVTEFRAVDK